MIFDQLLFGNFNKAAGGKTVLSIVKMIGTPVLSKLKTSKATGHS